MLFNQEVVTPSTSNTRYILNQYITYSNFSIAHHKFVHNISHLEKPASYKQAHHNPKWVEAMQVELCALTNNNTWTMVPLPPGHHPINCKWIFKIKYNSNGTVEHYKAQLVAKGFTKCEGIAYKETFASIAKPIIVHCLLTIVVVRNWDLHQMEVQNTFLHGELFKEVKMHLPRGFCR